MIKDLINLINNSRIPIIVIESHEERRILEILREVSFKTNYNVLAWSVTDGLSSFPRNPVDGKRLNPEGVLKHIWNLKSEGIYVLLDFHHYLSEPLHIRLLKEIAQQSSNYNQTIVLLSHDIDLPDELEPHAASLNLSLPDESQLKQVFRKIARKSMQKNSSQNFEVDKEAVALLIKNMKGLSQMEAERIIHNALQDHAITQEDVTEAAKAKYNLLNKDGVLYFEHDTSTMSEVGGLQRLKEWLEKRKPIFLGEHSLDSIDLPRGVLLLGVQGSGKSLAAKAVAGSWGVPLLRLDFGSLFDKFHGETERKLRESLKLAERMDPCILWLDEIEKGIATDSHDGGTSKRLLGMLLTWMAERKSAVLIVATSNDIQSLPPELMRKGRMDEIFFVDLPNRSIREDIFRIHLEMRNLKPDNFDLHQLAEASKGFSGAEIEQAVVSALYSSIGGSGKITQDLLLNEINATHPLSKTMDRQIAEMRNWAEGRTVPAN